MRRYALALLCLVPVAVPANAVPVSIVFEGTLSIVYDPYWALSFQGNLHPGDPFQFSITFDESAAPTGNYYLIPGDASVEVGSFSYAGSGSDNVYVELFNDSGGADFINLSGGVVAGASAAGQVRMYGPVTWLSSENLADVPWTDLTGGSLRTFDLIIYQYQPGTPVLYETGASGSISSITFVPEPATAVLIGAGLVLVLASLRRAD